MAPMQRNIISLIMVTLAIACGTLAVMWPQWRTELGAQGYYGYFMPRRTSQIEVEPASSEQQSAKRRAFTLKPSALSRQPSAPES